MSMEIEEKKEDRGADLKKVFQEVIEAATETIGTLSSPATLWLIVLWNCSGGKGFSGFTSNPDTEHPIP